MPVKEGIQSVGKGEIRKGTQNELPVHSCFDSENHLLNPSGSGINHLCFPVSPTRACIPEIQDFLCDPAYFRFTMRYSRRLQVG